MRVFVTGATGFVGSAVVEELLGAGHQVYLGARDVDRGQAAAAQVRGEGAEVSFVELKLLQSATLNSTVAYVHREAGRLDILVNNAGISVPGDGPPSRAGVSSVEQGLHTNFPGAFAVTQAFYPWCSIPPPGASSAFRVRWARSPSMGTKPGIYWATPPRKRP